MPFPSALLALCCLSTFWSYVAESFKLGSLLSSGWLNNEAMKQEKWQRNQQQERYRALSISSVLLVAASAFLVSRGCCSMLSVSGVTSRRSAAIESHGLLASTNHAVKNSKWGHCDSDAMRAEQKTAAKAALKMLQIDPWPVSFPNESRIIKRSFRILFSFVLPMPLLLPNLLLSTGQSVSSFSLLTVVLLLLLAPLRPGVAFSLASANATASQSYAMLLHHHRC